MPFLVAGAMLLVAALARRVSVSGVLTTAPASLGQVALKRTIFGAFGLLALAAPAAADDQTTCRAGGDDGIAACSRLIFANPSNASAFFSRCFAYNNKGDYDRAITDMNEAIRLDPENAVAFSNRGLAYAGRGDNDRAIADYNEAIRLDAKSAAAFANHGNAYRDKRDYDRAIADYSEAIRLDPKLTAAAEAKAAVAKV